MEVKKVEQKVEATLKVRSRYFQKGYPVQLTYPTLKAKITWDGDGLADIPTNLARRLLNKDEFGDGYELYNPEEEKKTARVRMGKGEVKESKDAEPGKEKEFIDSITG